MTAVEIEFNFDDRAKEAFKSGDIDPAVGGRVRVGETYVVGGPEAYTREYIEVFIIGLLEAGLAVLREESYVIDYYIDEMYLVFEHIEETRVKLAFCYTEEAVRNPEVRNTSKLSEPEAIASKVPLLEAIRTAAQNYLETLEEYNLADDSDHVGPLLSDMVREMKRSGC